MSLKLNRTHTIPEMTIRVAKSAFPQGNNIYMKIRDELGEIYDDEQFAVLFPQRGKPAEAPGRLAQITVMQFSERLTDREAADAVRSRIDWKYALGLELEDAGFHYSVLSKFRKRLLAGDAEASLLERMVSVLHEKALLRAGGKQRTDSTHIIGAIRFLNRLELVGETIRVALDTLAGIVPEWVQAVAEPEWFKRYGQPFNGYRMPKGSDQQEQLAVAIGHDGMRLWQALVEDEQLQILQHMPALEVLRRVWLQQYYYEDDQLHQRPYSMLPPGALRIVSPHDVQVRQSRKRSTSWQGYKVHITESCDMAAPRLITHIETRPATEQDYVVTADVEQALAKKQLTPAEHLADATYVSSLQIVASQQEHGIDLVGPVLPDTSWQALQPDAYDVSCFTIDWTRKRSSAQRGILISPGMNVRTTTVRRS